MNPHFFTAPWFFFLEDGILVSQPSSLMLLS